MVVWSIGLVGPKKEVAMQAMGRIWFMGLGIVLAACLSGASVFAEDKPVTPPVTHAPKVVITSPKDGDKVSDSFDLKYEMTKGSNPTHVHVYVDDEYQKGFSGTLKGLSKGTHQITVKGATKDHDTVAASHTITVEVE
jgi:Bacterial Ig domain